MSQDETITETDATLSKLRDALPAEHGVIVDKLVALTKRLDEFKATAAANRMRKLADYATVLPPEALPALLDSSAALDELEETIPNKGRWWRRLSLWGLIRNALTLVPLWWTWSALSGATAAYQNEVHLHPDLVYQPFLVLWQNGFGQGYAPLFSDVAGFDTFLFFVIIVLTIFIQRSERNAEKKARAFVAEMDATVMELVAVLGQSHEAISGKPTDWAKTVATVIQKAMSGAITAAKASEDASNRVADQVRDYIAHVNLQLERAREKDKAFFAQLHQSLMAEFKAASQSLITEYKTGSQSLMTEYKTGTEAFRRNFEQVNSKYETLAQQATEAVERASASVTQVHQDVLDAFEHINEENKQYFARANKDALDHIHGAAEEARKVTSEQLYPMLGEFQTTLAGFATQISAYTTSSQTLADSVSKIENVTQQLGVNAGQFATTAQSMEQRVQDVATATMQLSQSIGSAASELKAAAQETRAAASGLQVSATQTQDAAKQTIGAVASAQQLTDQVMDASRKWSDAQNSLKDVADKSKDGLNDIVRALKDAAERLASEQWVVVKRPGFWPFAK